MGDFHNRVYVRIRELDRRIIRLLGGLSNRDAEYDFACRQVTGENLRVLDVGGSESLLPLKLAKMGHMVTVCDFREYPEKHLNLTTVKGDFLKNSIPDKSFDYVLFVSTIEHIGFGGYGDPQYDNGDFKAMSEARRILKENGKIVFTFPFAYSEHILPDFERWYDIKRVRSLFKGMHVLAEEYYIPDVKMLGRIVKWLPASLEQIARSDELYKKFGCSCNACYTVSPTPRASFESK